MSSKTESKELEKRVLEFLCNQTQKFLFIDCSNSGLNGNEIFGVIQGLKVEESAENSAKRRKIELPQGNYLVRENQAYYKWNDEIMMEDEILEAIALNPPNLLVLELPEKEEIDRDQVTNILDLADEYSLIKIILASKKKYFFDDLFYWYHKVNMLKLKKPQPDFFPIPNIVDKGSLTDIITDLVHKGADINQQNGNKDTPLHLAVENGRIDLVRHLLSLGADVNFINKQNRTVLHVALKNNFLDIADIILTESVDVSLKDNNGSTALHLAAGLGAVDIMTKLVKKGSDIQDKDNSGCTPLMHACKGGKYAVEYLLALVENVDIQNILEYAVETGNSDVIDSLVDFGADVDFKNGELTPLYTAASIGDLDTVNALLHHGANPNTVSMLTGTPLQSAVSKCHKKVVQTLLNAGSRVDIIFEGKSLVHIAAEFADKDILLALLRNNADACSKDKKGNTALHYAVSRNCINMIDILMGQRIDINAKNGQFHTALYSACEYDFPDVVRRLIYHKADVSIKEKYLGWSPLHRACEKGHLNVVRVLLDAGANFDEVGESEDTPLHVAVKNGREEIVEELVRRGADVTAVDSYEESALDIARRKKSKKIIELLSKKIDEH